MTGTDRPPGTVFPGPSPVAELRSMGGLPDGRPAMVPDGLGGSPWAVAEASGMVACLVARSRLPSLSRVSHGPDPGDEGPRLTDEASPSSEASGGPSPRVL